VLFVTAHFLSFSVTRAPDLGETSMVSRRAIQESLRMTYNFTISQRAPWRSVWEVQYSGSATRDEILYGNLSDQNLIPLNAFFNPISDGADR